MTVKELIAELQTRNQDQTVYVWDAMDDRDTDEIHLSETDNGLLIASIEI